MATARLQPFCDLCALQDCAKEHSRAGPPAEGCELSQVQQREGAEHGSCSLTPRAQGTGWIVPATFSLSFTSHCSFCVLQNLAIGAGAVGSLQLTYISKVMLGWGRGKLSSPCVPLVPVAFPGEAMPSPGSTQGQVLVLPELSWHEAWVGLWGAGRDPGWGARLGCKVGVQEEEELLCCEKGHGVARTGWEQEPGVGVSWAQSWH